jgi:hypothetical protein
MDLAADDLLDGQRDIAPRASHRLDFDTIALGVLNHERHPPSGV